jgi:glycine/D-amino acid oxidase-like deaminating enzyme
LERCVDRLEGFIDEAGLRCDKIRPGFLRVATTDSYVRRLQRQAELMRSLGFEGITWVDAAATREMVDSERYLGAMWEPRLVLVDPAKLVREQKRYALGLGARVFEDSPVLAIAKANGRGGGVYRLLTPHGSMTARKLAFATNAYSHRFGELARMQVPAFTYMIATEPLTPEQHAPIGWEGNQGIEDARNLIHYYRLTPDKRIVIGGGPVGLAPGGELDRDRDQRAWRHLEQHIHWLWPHLSDVAITHRWGGPFSVTLDLIPALGHVGSDRTAVYSLGCHRAWRLDELPQWRGARRTAPTGQPRARRRLPIREPECDPMACRAARQHGQVRAPRLPTGRRRISRKATHPHQPRLARCKPSPRDAPPRGSARPRNADEDRRAAQLPALVP